MTLSDIGRLGPAPVGHRRARRHGVRRRALLELQPARDVERGVATLREHLSKVGGTIFSPNELDAGHGAKPWFVPASPPQRAAPRRAGTPGAGAPRHAREILPRAAPVGAARALVPDDALTFLANVYNQKARDFYVKHGVKVKVEARPTRSHEEAGPRSA